MITINVSDAPPTYAWEVHVSWDPNLLEAFYNAEGDFLDRSTYPTIFVSYPSTFAEVNVEGEIAVRCSLYGYVPMNEWASGNGELFGLGFRVKAEGSCILDLFDTRLWDHMEAGSPASTYYPNEDSYFSNIPPAVVATVDIDPDALNLRSKGQWITAYIQLPEEHNAEDIDVITILLNETIQPVLDPKHDFVTNSSEYLIDHNGDGILERMVKFNRTDVASWVYDDLGIQYGNVTLTITGELYDGTPFEGTDTVRVLFPGDVDDDGAVTSHDLSIIAGCYGTSIENPSYDLRADFNEDGCINSEDLSIMAGNYGKTAV